MEVVLTSQTWRVRFLSTYYKARLLTLLVEEVNAVNNSKLLTSFGRLGRAIHFSSLSPTASMFSSRRSMALNLFYHAQTDKLFIPFSITLKLVHENPLVITARDLSIE